MAIFVTELTLWRIAAKVGHKEGEKDGYERGFIEGQAGADQWWINRDFEVREAQVKMRDEERWP